MPYNRVSFTYSVDVTVDGWYTESYTVWGSITATNVISYPDGTIKWGSTSSEDYDFFYKYSELNYEDCVNVSIMEYKNNYNISEVEDIYSYINEEHSEAAS